MDIGQDLSRAEREVTVSKCADEDAWSVYCSDPVVARRLTAIAKSWNAEVVEAPRAIKVKLPKGAIAFRKRRILSEKQRAHIESLAGARG